MSELAHAGSERSNHTANCVAVDFSWRGLFRDIFPEKTAQNVATFSRTGVRAAEYVVAGDSEPSTGALINLLRSPIGQRVLDALTDGIEWRGAELRLLEICDHEQKLEKLKQEIRELDRATSPRR